MLNSLFAQEQTPPVVEQGFTLTQPVATVLASSGVLLAALLAFIATWLGRRQTEKHFRLSNHRDRFTTVAGQLADPSAAVRIAGVYAMEALADDWLQYRWYTLPKKRKTVRHEAQTCINVLCSYLCLPYEPSGREQTHTKTVIRYEPSDRVVEEHHEHHTEDSQVRQSILRIIAAHLRPDARTSWSGFDFDFTGAYLENADFDGCVFRGRVGFMRTRFYGYRTTFKDARFHGNTTLFGDAQFHGKDTTFANAQFHGKDTTFANAQFDGAHTSFSKAQFRSEHTWFSVARFHSRRTSFAETAFHSETTSFAETHFNGSITTFSAAQFHGTQTSFNEAKFHGRTSFKNAQFRSEEETSFEVAQFLGNQCCFDGSEFRSRKNSFELTEFHTVIAFFRRTQFHGDWTSFDQTQLCSRRTTSFAEAEFQSRKTSFTETGFRGRVDFSNPRVWRNVVVDWQWPLPSGQEDPAPVQPASVRPVDWPPVVASPSATVSVR